VLTIVELMPVVEPYALVLPKFTCDVAGALVFQSTWTPLIVAAVAVALLMLRGVESPAGLEFALLTNPAHPFSPILATLRRTVARRPRNLSFVFVVERIAVNIIIFPPFAAVCPQAVSARVPDALLAYREPEKDVTGHRAKKRTGLPPGPSPVLQGDESARGTRNARVSAESIDLKGATIS